MCGDIKVKSRTHLQALMLRVALSIIIIDQITKVIAVATLENRDNLILVPALFGERIGPILQFSFIRNPGAAFGFGTNATLIFTILAFVISIIIWKTGKKIENRVWAICFGALLGGAIGNLIDRIFRSPGAFRGAVVDFVQIPFWAIFNVADMAVSISATIIAIMTLMGKDPYKKKLND